MPRRPPMRAPGSARRLPAVTMTEPPPRALNPVWTPITGEPAGPTNEAAVAAAVPRAQPVLGVQPAAVNPAAVTPQGRDLPYPAAATPVAQVHQAALNHANQNLARLHTVAGVVNDPTLRDILGGELPPLQKYAVASKRWAELAQAAGYQDPRAWLKDMMKKWRTS